MLEFKNPKAIELLKEAKELEDFVSSKEPELEKNNLPFPDYYLELLTRAVTLRMLAEDLELGKISEEDLEDA